MTAVYFSLENHGADDDRLIGVDVPGADASIHRTIEEDGIARMREVDDGLELPAGEVILFKPLSYHVMVNDLPEALVLDDTMSVALTFEHAGRIMVEARIANSAP